MAFPFLDGLFVSFQGTTFRFLTGPIEASQQSSHMGTVKLDVELPLDHLGDARGGPKVRGVTPGQGTLQQQFRQFGQLTLTQPRWTPRSGFCFQALCPASS